MTQPYRGWEYARAGDYHCNLDPNWSYTPTYLRKMAFVRQKIRDRGTEARILDAGCGEGALVQELKVQGFQIEGLDLNYESEYVRRGSVLEMPYAANTFDVVLLLDVFEHLGYADQPVALAEIRRVLRERGELIASIPNLAHWNSRFRLTLFGQLDRTDVETNHVGERPFVENRSLLHKAGFEIVQVKGVTLTVPFVYRHIICKRPAWFRWLHDLLEPLAVPSLAMLNIFVCRKV
jgi:2-polyprenyl-3-methyl-5-hydroxy-6-metoxy-1,4-benzoquinol methylase